MLPYTQRPLLSLLVLLLPITPTLAEDTPSYRLSKDQLRCLYDQADSLLSEPADPLVVLLSMPCEKPSSSTLARGEKTELPVPNLTVDPHATAPLKPEEVLVLKKAQLTCFKQQFKQLTQQPEESINVVFSETCPIGNAHESSKP